MAILSMRRRCSGTAGSCTSRCSTSSTRTRSHSPALSLMPPPPPSHTHTHTHTHTPTTPTSSATYGHPQGHGASTPHAGSKRWTLAHERCAPILPGVLARVQILAGHCPALFLLLVHRQARRKYAELHDTAAGRRPRASRPSSPVAKLSPVCPSGALSPLRPPPIIVTHQPPAARRCRPPTAARS